MNHTVEKVACGDRQLGESIGVGVGGASSAGASLAGASGRGLRSRSIRAGLREVVELLVYLVLIILQSGQEQSCVAASLGWSKSGDASLHGGQGVDDLGPRGFGGVGKYALERRVTNSRRRGVDDLGS